MNNQQARDNLEGEETDGHPFFDYEPFTSSFFWYTMEGFLQRVMFALTMGVAAVMFSALLWTVSLPLVAWNVVRWVASKVGAGWSGVNTQRGRTRPWCSTVSRPPRQTRQNATFGALEPRILSSYSTSSSCWHVIQERAQR